MKFFYITCNTLEEAKAISYDLLQQQIALCTNWFPIHCAYRYQGRINEEQEVALLVKTQDHARNKIEKIVTKHLSYTQCIAEIDIHSINEKFLTWLNQEVPPLPRDNDTYRTTPE